MTAAGLRVAQDERSIHWRQRGLYGNVLPLPMPMRCFPAIFGGSWLRLTLSAQRIDLERGVSATQLHPHGPADDLISRTRDIARPK